MKVEAVAVNHPGGCLSYRVTETKAGVKRTFVYCTDFEPDNNGEDDRLVELWGGAEVVIADAQYEVGSSENPFMKGWGHSDYVTDVNMALRARVRRLALTHHEPKMDDRYHDGLELRARSYAQQKSSDLEVVLAKEGLELGW